MPFYRQARLQAMVGVPLAESVQYERCAFVAGCVRPVYEALMRCAASAEVIHTDDTRLVILELLKENKGLPAARAAWGADLRHRGARGRAADCPLCVGTAT